MIGGKCRTGRPLTVAKAAGQPSVLVRNVRHHLYRRRMPFQLPTVLSPLENVGWKTHVVVQVGMCKPSSRKQARGPRGGELRRPKSPPQRADGREATALRRSFPL